MARIVSRVWRADELLPPPPPPPSRSVRLKRLTHALGRVPFVVWAGLATFLQVWSWPLCAFALGSLGAWRVLALMMPAEAPARPRRRAPRRRRHWRVDRAQWVALDEPGRVGLAGEKLVIQDLAAFPDDWVVLHNLLVPTAKGPTQVDVLVVAPSGLWCLEVKAWAGRVLGQERDAHWTQVRWTGRKRLNDQRENPVRQNAYHCQALAAYLADHGVYHPVDSVVVFTRARLSVKARTPVISLEELRAQIALKPGLPPLSPAQVMRVAGTLRPLAGAELGAVCPEVEMVGATATTG